MLQNLGGIDRVATAVAMQGEAHVFLTYDALLRYVTGTLDEAKPSLDDEKMNKIYTDREARRRDRLHDVSDFSARRQTGCDLRKHEDRVQSLRRRIGEGSGRIRRTG